MGIVQRYNHYTQTCRSISVGIRSRCDLYPRREHGAGYDHHNESRTRQLGTPTFQRSRMVGQSQVSGIENHT